MRSDESDDGAHRGVGDRGESRIGTIAVLAIALIVFPLFVLLAYYASLNVVATDSSLFNFGNLGQLGSGFRVITTVNVTGITTSINESAILNQPKSNFAFPSFPKIPVTIWIVFVLIIFLALALGIARNYRNSSKVSAEFSTEDISDEEESEEAQNAARHGLAEALDDAILKLREGDDYRRTVLECYRKISSILESKSKVKGISMTPREFQSVVSNRLGLGDNEYLSRVTELFEVARYSEHEVSRENAEIAIDCLSNLSLALKGEES